MQGMVDYFETYYETYGRKVKLVFVEGTGIASRRDRRTSRRRAHRRGHQTVHGVGWPGVDAARSPTSSPPMADCLHRLHARRSRRSSTCDRDPLVWGIASGGEQTQVHVLEMIQKQLIGKNGVARRRRVRQQPAQVRPALHREQPDVDENSPTTFAAQWTANGAPLAERVPYTLDPATIQQTASQAIAKFKAAGVTTIDLQRRPGGAARLHHGGNGAGLLPGVDASGRRRWSTSTPSPAPTTRSSGRTRSATRSWRPRVTPEISGYFALYQLVPRRQTRRRSTRSA